MSSLRLYNDNLSTMISVDIEGVILSIPPNGYISILDKNVDDAIREIKRYTLGSRQRYTK